MKKLSLDKTWSECLRMWKWIAKQRKQSSEMESTDLKRKWLEDNGYDPYEVFDMCFFCAYDRRFSSFRCSNCPARKVDKRLRTYFCDDFWIARPVKFYAKLVSLNKKRLARKRKTKKRKK